jgi:hypothetical protein
MLRAVLVDRNNWWWRGLGALPTDDGDPASLANRGLVTKLLRRNPEILVFWRHQDVIIAIDGTACVRWPLSDLLGNTDPGLPVNRQG